MISTLSAGPKEIQSRRARSARALASWLVATWAISGCLASSPRGEQRGDEGGASGGAVGGEGGDPAPGDEGGGDDGAATGDEGAATGDEGGDDGGPSWPLLIEAETFEVNRHWAVCPGSDCEDDRSDRASGDKHLITFEDRVSDGDEAALTRTLDLPSGGEIHVWALSVRAGDGRAWSVTLSGGQAAVVGEDDAQQWERAGSATVDGDGKGVDLVLRDAAPDAYWAYPDAVLLTDAPNYDPNEVEEEEGTGGGDASDPDRDTRCDDGSELTCDASPPDCRRWELLAIQGGCWVCAGIVSCRASGGGGDDGGGEGGEDPGPGEEETSACVEQGDWCVGRRDDCGAGYDRERGLGCPGMGARCCVRSTSCDDESELTCFAEKPVCREGEALALSEGCWACVNPDTCLAWGTPGCSDDGDCPAASRCGSCGARSEPGGDECVPACVRHDCRTEAAIRCVAGRPDCGDGGVAVIRDGCWLCVDRNSCDPVEDDNE